MWTTTRIGPSPALALDEMGRGPLVVFLHGVGGNRSNWHDNLPAFAAYFHAVAWDARGYGGSEDPAGPVAFTDYRDDLFRVLDHFGAERAHLVGLSMGGRIALAFHAAAPERVASLTLCDTHLGFRHLSAEDRAKFIAKRAEPLLAGKTPADIAPRLARTLIGDPAHTEALAKLVASMEALRTAPYLAAIRASTEEDLDPLVEGVAVPTLVLAGALDRVTPPSLAEAIVARIAGAKLAIIEDAGHLSNIEAPEAFNRVVLAFLAEIEG
ncbi:alpha/beta hydrolase [Acuticoccus sp. M5D2P5]|uniref:alpha/beta fold hydrolase n=1 Tax=Acuticoccus kalidii TaxID=2910977 RepID=UPI001F25A32B|nr:alpha/beta fold hydrolase [Acuticoccus kalidii]MCF3936592.1 alpha/beta hydrolase [Acuticoccus kalidii]